MTEFPDGLGPFCADVGTIAEVSLLVRAGVVAGASYSAELAVFEPGAKHSFDHAAGRNIANPTAAILAAAKLLQVSSLS